MADPGRKLDRYFSRLSADRLENLAFHVEQKTPILCDGSLFVKNGVY